MSEENQQTFNYGGQAVIEGVMMRGSRVLSVGVRNPEGQIVIHTEPLNQRVYNGRWFKTPFLRGLILLWDALGLGIKSLMFSADVALDESDGGYEGNDGEPSQAFSTPVQVGTILLSLSMSIGLFFVLPAAIGGWVVGFTSPFWGNVAEGAVRLLLLIGYVSLIALMEDVRRLYGYHGAEHKTINAYEAEAELTPENVATFPIEHPRCGTAFLLTVVIISILLYSMLPSFAPDDTLLWRIGERVLTRIVLLPVVAGIAYEYIRFTAKHLDNPIIKVLTKPNLALQRLTTRQPDLKMIEVAIAAFEQVLEAEKAEELPEGRTFTLGLPEPLPSD